MKKLVIGAFAAILVCASVSANADVQLPTEKQILGIRNLCAGGDVQSIDAKLAGALRTWRLDPAAQLDVRAARKNLGAVLEKVSADAAGNALYATYVACVKDALDQFVTRANTTLVQPRI